MSNNSVKLSQVAATAAKFNNDVEAVKRELKRIASVKCRLKKQKAKSTYEQEMREVLAEEQLMKEVRDYLTPKKLTVTRMTAEDIAKLTYDETVKAIKSIQSKKCNSQYLTERLEDNVEYQEACRIEEMLKAHREKIRPLENAVSKHKVNEIVQHLEGLEDKIDKEYVLELLKKLQG